MVAQAIEFTPFLAPVFRMQQQQRSPVVLIGHRVTQYALDLSQSGNIVV